MVAPTELGSIQAQVLSSERQRAMDLAVNIIAANKGVILDSDSNPLLKEVREILGPDLLNVLIVSVRQQ